MHPFSTPHSPLKTLENLKVFWCFQGVEKECIGTNGLITVLLFGYSNVANWQSSWVVVFLVGILANFGTPVLMQIPFNPSRFSVSWKKEISFR